MDKRTLFFVFALTMTLFLVNMFFDERGTDDLRKWNEQQIAKKKEKIVTLTKAIEKRNDPVLSLPNVELYADEQGKQPLATAIKSGSALITLSWTQDLPKNVYVKSSEGKLVEFSLATLSDSLGAPVIYRKSATDTLVVGELPDFGRYELQLVVPPGLDPDKSAQTTVYAADYIDGHLEIPSENIVKLKQEIEKIEGEISTPSIVIHEAFVLLKTTNGYLPAAIIQGANRNIDLLDSLKSLSGAISKEKKQGPSITNLKNVETFYVLETPYQQLVFSNYGGALVENNLPFQSKTNEDSVVKEIEFDRDMVKQHPYNARFPAHAYNTPGSLATGPFIEHSEGVIGGYYPLLRRDLIEKDKKKSIRVLPRYYSLNIVSEYPETAELVYTVKSFTKEQIVFEAVQGHRRITKTFSVASEAQAPYCIDLTINIEGDSRGLWLTSGIPEVEWISGATAPVLKYRITRNGKPDVETVDLPKDALTSTSTALDWICNSNGFLGMILDPISETTPGYRAQFVPGNIVPSRLLLIDQQYNVYKAEDLPGYMMMLPLKASGGSMNFRIFAGPFADGVLKTVDRVYSNSTTGYNPDYIACQSFHGWFSFISEPFAKFLFVLMNFFHTMTGSWAFSIVLLTVALRIMLYPLNAWSTKSMVRMQQIAPEVAAIQERNKKDPKKGQLEIMALYRERGVNPVSGCLPLLIQMPFLIGMFDLLKSTFELRGASFIPGWIENLTAPDVLFSWSMPIFFIGTQFHLLPILLGGVMLLQQHLMSTLPKDPSLWTDQQRQQRLMGNIMAVVFAVMFYNFPSGLNIYWLSSMLLGMLQQYLMTKRLNKEVAKAVVTPVKLRK